MPFIPSANVVRVALDYQVSGLPAANILHMSHAAGALTQAEVDGMAAEVQGVWATILMPFLTSNVTLVGTTVTDASSATGPQGFDGTATAGSSGSSPLPPNVALCVTTRTALRSRSGRGRTYLPGIGEDKVDGAGTVVGSFVTSIQTAFSDMDASLDAGTYNLGMGVLSLFTTDPGPPPVPNTPRLAGLFSRATAYTVDATIDSQRRRLR